MKGKTMDQMESVEETAKTVEEAVEIGLRQLGVDRDQAEIEIVSKGKTGILGFGSEPARVRVSLLKNIPEDAIITKGIVDQLLKYLGVDLVAYLKNASKDEEFPAIDIQGDDSGLLIGRKGETLGAFQFMVNYIARGQTGERSYANIDVEGYKERRREILEAQARSIASRVASSGHSFTLDPMSPAERRIVHMALSEHSDIVTESSGDEGARRITVAPKRR
jgi:spoIIIJ-associated protein